MTDSFDWDDNTQEDTNATGPKALRDAYKDQMTKNKELAEQVKKLADEVRASKLEKKLASKGVPEKAVGLFPKDVEPTDDEVTKWIGQYGDLFGSPATQTTETTTEIVEPTQLESSLEQMQKVSQTAPPAGPKNNLMAMLQNPNLVDEVPFEEFLAAMKENGALKT